WLGHFVGGLVSVAVNTGFSIVQTAFNLGSLRDLTGQGTMLDGLFAGFVPWIVTAFGFSFFWTASSAMYLVLRREVDHTEFDMIDMDAPGLPKPLPPLSPAPGSEPEATTPDAKPAE
ncbi:MAG: hypothetical protein ACK6DC_21770, partial [Planctomycetota bacterium]